MPMGQMMECAGSRDKIITVDDGKTRYIVHESDTDVRFPHHDDFSLVTVFDVPDSVKKTIHRDWIRDQVNTYMKHDDVFHESFLAGVIFRSAAGEELVVSDESRAYLAEHGNRFIVFVNADHDKDTPSPGPYVVLGERLRNVDGGAFSILQLKDCQNCELSIALPSKLRATLNPTGPLAGWRIAIKDNIHLKGIRTSVGNYVFSQIFPPQPKTAACIQRLVNQGAVIVGKTKMNSFGNWEEPLEYIDYQAPWNPRADGYQSTGGSSSGSAAAVAAYEWVDVAIGTDTSSWFKDTILKDGFSNALVVMLLESMCERYRDEVPTVFWYPRFKRPPQSGINALALAPVLEAPALAVPIGEISYNSLVSGNEEKLPFAVTVMSPPGIVPLTFRSLLAD
ncbi:amidase signature domain-containing protein [Aspergillus egyptiacus]|nr:amidase signature domain-containing protein [Aspergillus egyptiacus]